MYSNSPFKRYFFAAMGLWIAFIGVFVYFFCSEGKEAAEIFGILTVSSLSFIFNIITILSSKFRKRRKIWALIIYGFLFASSLYEFMDMNIGITYLLFSVVLLLILDIFPISSSLKYFNIGMLITLSGFLYFPVGIFILLFLVITILFYEEKVNISQYLAGVLVTIVLALEITYLTDSFFYITEWIDKLNVPEFHFKYQIPILIILITILVYGWISQYSENNIADSVEVANIYSILVLYLLFWIIVYAFFMGDNYGLLIFVSLPVGMVISRSL
ncbi:MAG: DUF6427 family protein [Flavobacteriaceae bacterium]|jgi:hypothetical protein|nr:DUF6427 family protein [Flavobacteriaceae bacterium]